MTGSCEEQMGQMMKQSTERLENKKMNVRRKRIRRGRKDRGRIGRTLKRMNLEVI